MHFMRQKKKQQTKQNEHKEEKEKIVTPPQIYVFKLSNINFKTIITIPKYKQHNGEFYRRSKNNKKNQMEIL